MLERVLLPATDLEVSRLSFGAGTAAGLMIWGDHHDQVATVERAFEHGINHFDTSSFYGRGASEVNLGRVLKAIGEEHILTTKVHLAPLHLSVPGALTRAFVKSVEESLVRLQRDNLDIVLLHNATHFGRDLHDPVMPHLSLDDVVGDADSAWLAAERLREQGKVRYFGVSGQDNDPSAVRALIGSGRITTFNQPYNLLNPTAGLPRGVARDILGPEFTEQNSFMDFTGTIDFAGQHSVGVSVISPVAAGVLTWRAQEGRPVPAHSGRARRFLGAGQFERELGVAGHFRSVAKDHGMNLTELAYRFTITRPEVQTVVGGFSDIAQLDEAAAALQRGPLPPDVLTALKIVWAKEGQ